jgi:DNA-binding transcriptional regulator LsrR (DeoR family)
MSEAKRSRQPAPERLMIAEVARLYYEEEWTQARLSAEMGLSQSQISRILKEARELGIVEIRVHHPFRTAPALEKALAQRLGLADCRVLASGSVQAERERDISARTGALAAQFLQEAVADNTVIGMGWGSMVFHTVASGYLTKKRGMTVVQIQGSAGGPTQDADGARLVGALGRALGARTFYLNAPMVVADTAVRTGLLRDPHIRQTIEIGRRAETLVVGVGAVSQQSGLYRAGYLNDADLDEIAREGGVGDICGRYFRRDGSLCDLEIDSRIVALSAEAMRAAPLRVGVSCGVTKALPNLAAVRSGLINVLITDEDAAAEMLDLIAGEERSA